MQEAKNKLKTTLFNCVGTDFEHLKKQLTEAESENVGNLIFQLLI